MNRIDKQLTFPEVPDVTVWEDETRWDLFFAFPQSPRYRLGPDGKPVVEGDHLPDGGPAGGRQERRRLCDVRHGAVGVGRGHDEAAQGARRAGRRRTPAARSAGHTAAGELRHHDVHEGQGQSVAREGRRPHREREDRGFADALRQERRHLCGGADTRGRGRLRRRHERRRGVDGQRGLRPELLDQAAADHGGGLVQLHAVLFLLPEHRYRLVGVG